MEWCEVDGMGGMGNGEWTRRCRMGEISKGGAGWF
jgi:hypothetical protein